MKRFASYVLYTLLLAAIACACSNLFPLTKKVFRLYYTSRCTDQQNLDVYIEDNAGQVVQKSFSFSNESKEAEE